METEPSNDVQMLGATPALASALIGPIVAGAAAQLLLFGIFFVVFVNYAGSSAMASHSRTMKVALWSVAALTTFQSGLCFEEIFRLAVSQKRTVDEILAASWELAIAPLITGLVGVICTTLLASRASSLFTSAWARWIYRTFVGLFISTSFLGACITTAIGFMYLKGTEDQALPLTFNTGVTIWLMSAMAVDLSITAALYYNLRTRKGRTNSAATRSVLATLVRTAVLTASYTAVVSVGGAAVSVAFDENRLDTTDVQYAMHLPLSSLYALSLCVTLFSRQKVSEKLHRVAHTDQFVSESGGERRRRSPLRIEVQTQRSICVEEEPEDDGKLKVPMGRMV